VLCAETIIKNCVRELSFIHTDFSEHKRLAEIINAMRSTSSAAIHARVKQYITNWMAASSGDRTSKLVRGHLRTFQAHSQLRFMRPLAVSTITPPPKLLGAPSAGSFERRCLPLNHSFVHHRQCGQTSTHGLVGWRQDAAQETTCGPTKDTREASRGCTCKTCNARKEGIACSSFAVTSLAFAFDFWTRFQGRHSGGCETRDAREGTTEGRNGRTRRLR
jgi:hypothetical protein